MRSKKKVLPTEHEKHNFYFYSPSRLIMQLLAGHAQFWPVLAGLRPEMVLWGLGNAPISRAGGADYVSLHNKLPQMKQGFIVISNMKPYFSYCYQYGTVYVICSYYCKYQLCILGLQMSNLVCPA